MKNSYFYMACLLTTSIFVACGQSSHKKSTVGARNTQKAIRFTDDKGNLYRIEDGSMQAKPEDFKSEREALDKSKTQTSTAIKLDPETQEIKGNLQNETVQIQGDQILIDSSNLKLNISLSMKCEIEKTLCTQDSQLQKLLTKTFEAEKSVWQSNDGVGSFTFNAVKKINKHLSEALKEALQIIESTESGLIKKMNPQLILTKVAVGGSNLRSEISCAVIDDANLENELLPTEKFLLIKDNAKKDSIYKELSSDIASEATPLESFSIRNQKTNLVCHVDKKSDSKNLEGLIKSIIDITFSGKEDSLDLTAAATEVASQEKEQKESAATSEGADKTQHAQDDIIFQDSPNQ